MQGMSHDICKTSIGSDAGVSKAKLVITAIVRTGMSQVEAARRYGISEATVSRWMQRYRTEGDTAFEPRSRRPHHNRLATPPDVIGAVVAERDRLIHSGHDAGPDTISWHLEQAGIGAPSRATIARILTANGRVRPQPKKKPKSSYHRFQAEQPNETWQSDFTHYRLADGTDAEIITWLDDHSRYLLHLSAHSRITGPIVLSTFQTAIAEYGCPASTLTDNGMVYTVRHSATGVRGGRNTFEHYLAARGITQKNGRGNHPQTQGKVERFQQTLKNWLRRQGEQPDTIEQLQNLLDRFRHEYNHDRPHTVPWPDAHPPPPTSHDPKRHHRVNPRTEPTTASATTKSAKAP
jgi:transposase InsO family protein